MKTKPRIQSVCLSLLFLAWTAALHAAQFGDFSYESSGTGGIIITGYTGAGGDVTVPDTIAGLPVTSIRYAAFHGCHLTSVAIPESVTSIGNSAFAGCIGLTSITIPDTVTSIE